MIGIHAYLVHPPIVSGKGTALMTTPKYCIKTQYIQGYAKRKLN